LILCQFNEGPIPAVKFIDIATEALINFGKGYLSELDSLVANLNADASANQFEQAMANFGRLLGVAASRHGDAGVGPDRLWLALIYVVNVSTFR